MIINGGSLLSAQYFGPGNHNLAFNAQCEISIVCPAHIICEKRKVALVVAVEERLMKYDTTRWNGA